MAKVKEEAGDREGDKDADENPGHNVVSRAEIV